MIHVSFKEFNDKYMKPSESWDFSLFKITCVKCGSTKVEVNGDCETEPGYYGEISFYGHLIVKCHDCGNAITKIVATASDSNSYCTCDE